MILYIPNCILTNNEMWKKRREQKQSILRPTPKAAHSFKVGMPSRSSSVDPKKLDQYKTTEIPDFKAIHTKQERELLRRRYENQFVTKPEPFVFHATTRSLKPPPVKADDWRWDKKK